MLKMYHATSEFRCVENNKISGKYEKSCTPQFAMVLIKKGSVRLKYSKNDIIIKEGQVFLRIPELKHDVIYLEDTITFSLALPSSVYQLFKMVNEPSLSRLVLEVGLDKQLLNGCQKMLKLHNGSQLIPPFKVILSGMEWMEKCFELDRRNYLNGQGMVWLPKALQILENNLELPLSMELVAKQLKLSYSLFRKNFKKEMNVSPHEYRLRCKMELVKHRLLHDVSIKRIAEELNYSDVFALSAQFKRFAGLSPRGWKVQNI